MPNTTNYNWVTPSDSDLVKDGAAAIRTLGSSIDSTLKTQIDAQIPDSLLTTKGDLIAATGASTPARLGVGTNGQVLLADSSAATGVAWGTPSSGSMTQLATGTVSGTSVVLSSISQSYKHLYYVLTSVQCSVANSIAWRLNGDSATNYATTTMSLNNTTIGNRQSDSVLLGDGSGSPVAPTTANNNTWTLFIQNYSLGKAKPIYMTSNSATTKTQANYTVGSWANNAAVTSITLTTIGGTDTFSVGTYTLYGVN